MHSVKLRYVSIWYVKPIVYLAFRNGAELGMPEIRELTFYAEKMSGRKPYVVLSDIRSKVNVTPEGRKLAADASQAPLHKGSAVIVKRSSFKLAANFFILLTQPGYPYQVFTREEKAIEWLLNIPL